MKKIFLICLGLFFTQSICAREYLSYDYQFFTTDGIATPIIDSNYVMDPKFDYPNDWQDTLELYDDSNYDHCCDNTWEFSCENFLRSDVCNWPRNINMVNIFCEYNKTTTPCIAFRNGTRLAHYIALCTQDHTATRDQQNDYKEKWLEFKDAISKSGVTLNNSDKKKYDTYEAWYDYVFSQSFIVDSIEQQSVYSVNGAIAQLMGDYVMGSTLSTDLDDIRKRLESESADLEKEINDIKEQQAKAQEALVTARQNAFDAFSSADIFTRGRIGTITNNSSVAYQLVASDGTVLDTISPGQTSSRYFALSDYDDSQLGSMFRLVPYDEATQIQEGTAEGALSGGTIVILFNMIGTNTPGNPYGYQGMVFISRVYPTVAGRAQGFDIGSLVQQNQYWEISFEIKPLQSVTYDDKQYQVIYPSISKVSTVTEVLDATQDLVALLDAEMDTVTNVTQANSSSDSYPAFSGFDMWPDVPKG